MALTDTFIRQVRHSGAPAGDKHTDGGGMHLLVKESGKYWRLRYRFSNKQKTLALGVYPAVSLALARRRREEARELIAKGEDPGEAKRERKQAKALADAQTFETVARHLLAKSAGERAASTQGKVTAWLENSLSGTFPAARGTAGVAWLGPCR